MNAPDNGFCVEETTTIMTTSNIKRNLSFIYDGLVTAIYLMISTILIVIKVSIDALELSFDISCMSLIEEKTLLAMGKHQQMTLC